MSTNRRAIRSLAAAPLVLALALSGCGGGVTTGNEQGSSDNTAGTAGSTGGGGDCDPKKVTLVTSGRGLDNEYYVAVNAGSKAFAKSVGLEGKYQWISSDGDSAKQLSQIKAILQRSGKCTVFNVDANEAAIVPAIVKAIEDKGAFLVTQWNRPAALTPMKSGPNWVAHMSIDGEPQGYAIAKAMFARMGNKGSIVALQGILDNDPAKERYAGLQRALKETPGIKMLAQQTAKWDRTQAQNVTQTWLTKYGNQINGVWAANDSMALGALTATKNAKRNNVFTCGVDGLAEAVQQIKTGNAYVATTRSQGAIQGGFGLAVGYAAATGKIKVADLPAAKRMFYLKTQPITTKSNVASLPAPTDVSDLDFKDVWSQTGSAIKAS